MRLIQTCLLAISCLLLLSCSDNDSSLPGTALQGCEIEQQNRFVHELLQQAYLWYQDIPETLDYSQFASPAETLEFLRNRPLDRFSNITDAAAFTNLFSAGQFVGYGFSFLLRDADTTLWIRFVYDDAPAGRAGLRRGDQILTINGRSIDEIEAQNLWGTIFGPDTPGYPVNMLIQDAAGTITSVDMQKDVVNINTVLHAEVVDPGTLAIGYLVFNSFLQTSNAELEQVFADFSAAGVRRLILDLRYNGGGAVSVANNLASHLHRVNDHSQLFTSLRYNDKNPGSNSSYFLLPLVDALDLEQLIVITTEATCSASEMVINGLRPYLGTVQTVGSTTCGKPVGMNPFQFCDNVILPVTFSAENRDGFSDYFDGLTTDCPAGDNVSFAFGDQNEPMLAQALHLANNAQCLPPARSAHHGYRSLTDPRNELRAIIGGAH